MSERTVIIQYQNSRKGVNQPIELWLYCSKCNGDWSIDRVECSSTESPDLWPVLKYGHEEEIIELMEAEIRGEDEGIPLAAAIDEQIDRMRERA